MLQGISGYLISQQFSNQFLAKCPDDEDDNFKILELIAAK